MDEVAWRLVSGYPSYEVSNCGEVRRTLAFKKHPAGMILKPKFDKKGYQQVTLSRSGRYGYFNAHRLVALAFLGEPPTRQHQVAHNDGNPKNNHLSNLRWATRTENAMDRILHGTVPDRKGERHPMVKLNDKLVLEIREERRQGRTYVELAQHYHRPKLTLYDAIVGATWRHLPGAVGVRRQRNSTLGI